jgi:uncharacterized protein YqeY
MIKQIKKDQLQARKDHDKVKSGVLTALVGEISIVGKNDGNRETTEEEAIKVITKFSKGVQEIISLTKGKNQESYDAAVKELEIYNKYLPTLMTEDELVKVIGLFLQTETNPNIGTVMKHLKTSFAGKYDGKMASKVIKEIL